MPNVLIFLQIRAILNRQKRNEADNVKANADSISVSFYRILCQRKKR